VDDRDRDPEALIEVARSEVCGVPFSHKPIPNRTLVASLRR
jgi:hypothetical protein